MQNTALKLKVASAIFFILAILHLGRVFLGISFTVADWTVPHSVSILIFVVGLMLSLWMFKGAAK